jgi:hypothetical protein
MRVEQDEGEYYLWITNAIEHESRGPTGRFDGNEIWRRERLTILAKVLKRPPQ